jgi:pimeloyl-ACP methyl ester carboxylesterase
MKLEVLAHRPDGGSPHPPLLFVHGAYVGAWCWAEYFLPFFANHGYEAHAVSLRGHGASPGRDTLHAATIDDYVNDVALAAGELGRAPVLIGHSMGAIVLQRAARRCNARAMVLMAPVPPHGLGGSLLSLALRDPPLFFALNALQFGGADVSSLRRIRDYLFSASLTEAEVSRYLRRTQQESQRVLLELSWPQYFWIASSVGVPALVLGAEKDAFFTTSMIDEAARFHGITPRIFPNMAHLMMLEPGWKDVATHIHAWLTKTLTLSSSPGCD